MKSYPKSRTLPLPALIASFLAFLIGTGSVAVLAAETLTLADAGTSGYTIVLPENPNPVQTTAANELAGTLKAISGARLPIVSESAVTAADLGEVPLAKHLGLWIAPVESTDTPFNIYVDRVNITF